MDYDKSSSHYRRASQALQRLTDEGYLKSEEAQPFIDKCKNAEELCDSLAEELTELDVEARLKQAKEIIPPLSVRQAKQLRGLADTLEEFVLNKVTECECGGAQND